MSDNDLLRPLLFDWLLTTKKPQVSERTFEKLMSLAKLYISPALGQIPIRQIDSTVLQAFLSENLFTGKDLSAATIKKCRCMLNDFFRHCCEHSVVSGNPLKDVAIKEKNATNKEKSTGLKYEDRQVFIDAVSAHRFWKPFCLTIMYTGIKIGELLPLKWKDIDFEGKSLTVSSMMTAHIAFDENGNVHKRNQGVLPVSGPKELPLSDKVIHILTEYRQFRERAQRQKRKYSYTDANDFVFGNEKGELRSYSGISHVLNKFLKSKGLTHLNIMFSALRHTFFEIAREERKERQKQKAREQRLAEVALRNLRKAKAIAAYRKTKKPELEM